jgi:SNF family Na+-dependent transporter
VSFGAINHRLEGVGIAQAFSAFVTALYYNTLVGYALYYFALSFSKDMPWLTTEECTIVTEENFIGTPIRPVAYFQSTFLGYQTPVDYGEGASGAMA